MLNTHYCCCCLHHVWWSPQKSVFIYALWSDPNVHQTICWITTARPLLQKLEVLHWSSNNCCFLHLANTYSIARHYCFLVEVLMAKQRSIRTNRAIGTSISIIPNKMMAAAVFAREPPTPGMHFHCWFYENILHQDFHCIGSPNSLKALFSIADSLKRLCKRFLQCVESGLTLSLLVQWKTDTLYTLSQDYGTPLGIHICPHNHHHTRAKNHWALTYPANHHTRAKDIFQHRCVLQ